MHKIQQNLNNLPLFWKGETMSKRSFTSVPLKRLFNVTDVVTILSYELSPSFYTTGESHDFWEMLYVDRGCISVESGSKRLTLETGQLFFHKPNDFHVVKCDGTQSASVFILSFVCKSPAMSFFGGRDFLTNKTHFTVIRALIDECNAGFEKSKYPLAPISDSPYGVNQLIKIKLEELLILLIRSEEQPPDSKRASSGKTVMGTTLANAIAEHLNENLVGRVRLEDLSRMLHYGKSTLCDIFKRTYGKTIIEYHTELKINEAKRMIFEHKMSVSEVAARLGFESPEYFSRTFHKYVGMSPRAFRTSLVQGNTVYLENEVKLEV